MTFTIRPAKYAKGKIAVAAEDGSGYKSRAAHMIEALGGRYVGRERAYLASPKQVADMELLLANSWAGRAGVYAGSRAYFYHPDLPGDYARAEAVKPGRPPRPARPA